MPATVLASTSPTRIRMLEAAGLAFDAMAPGIDERAVEAPLVAAGKSPADIALALAEAKALAVSRARPDALVIGADQTLALGDRGFSKPENRAAAATQLAALGGRTHYLHAGVAGARRGAVVWRHVESAAMTMRALSTAAIEAYLDEIGTAALMSVGAYQIEGPGIRLFDTIDGDYFAILGMPLLPVLKWLRSEGGLP